MGDKGGKKVRTKARSKKAAKAGSIVEREEAG